MSTHDDNLARVGLPRVETLVRRILRTFDAATPTDAEAGARWYDDARALAITLAADTGTTVDHAATVIAHLSPRTSWTRNVDGARALLGSGARASGIIQANYARALASVDAADPLATLNGPKSHSFALNIMGDDDAVTVDVWACRVVDVDPEKHLTRRGIYAAVAHAYRLAARRRGVDPTTMQATTWVVARNGRSE